MIGVVIIVMIVDDDLWFLIRLVIRHVVILMNMEWVIKIDIDDWMNNVDN